MKLSLFSLECDKDLHSSKLKYYYIYIFTLFIYLQISGYKFLGYVDIILKNTELFSGKYLLLFYKWYVMILTDTPVQKWNKFDHSLSASNFTRFWQCVFQQIRHVLTCTEFAGDIFLYVLWSIENSHETELFIIVWIIPRTTNKPNEWTERITDIDITLTCWHYRTLLFFRIFWQLSIRD